MIKNGEEIYVATLFKLIFGIFIFGLGFVLNSQIENSILSKIILFLSLIAIPFVLRNPYLVVLLTVILLPSRYIYTPVQKEIIADLKRYLFNRLMLRSKTYLTLAITGGIFLGFSLPAIVNYPISIIIVTFFVVALLWLIEFSNMKSFEEKIKEAAEKNGDPIESMRYAYKLMTPFSNEDIDEVIKDRIELFKNAKNR